LILGIIIAGIIVSSFFFPSLLTEYTILNIFTNRVTFAGKIFVIDELIVLFGLVILLLYIFNRNKNPSISKSVVFYIIFLTYLILSFTSAFIIRPDNSGSLILRNRWILINTLYFISPFILSITSKNIIVLLQRFIIFTLLLAIIKLILHFSFNKSSIILIISSDFSFFVSIACLIVLLTIDNRIIKVMSIIIGFLISLLSSQLSAILLFVFVSILGFGITLKNGKLKINYFAITTALIIVGFIISIYSYVASGLTKYFRLSILDFMVNTEIISRTINLWKTAISTVTNQHFWFGMGIGNTIEYDVAPWLGIGYETYNQSIAHNVFVTMFFSFGFIGFVLFVLTILPIFKRTAPILKEEKKELLYHLIIVIKISLFAIIFNFLTTPGIWKIRKGIVFWFLLGLFYKLKSDRKNANLRLN